MRLGIISDCVHYKNEKGQVGSENHILLRQFEQLDIFFEETIVACPFATVDNNKVITWYNKDIKFIELKVVGGHSFKDKFQILMAFPTWIRAFRKINRLTDIIYQRFPNNLNIPGFFYFYWKNKKVFGTYTGTWDDYENEPNTYRFQKWLLKTLFRGPVWVYKTGKNNENRIKSGISPSYSQAEWEEESVQVKERISMIQKHGLQKFRLITVGSITHNKNQISIIKACIILKQQHCSFSLKVVGDGPMLAELKVIVQQNQLEEEVEFVGKKNYQALRELYRQSDFVVQAPLKEGFGKVPLEGLFHGVIPVINNVSLAEYMTGNGDRGFLFEEADAQNLANTLLEIKNKISSLPAMIENGRMFAKKQTLESWANEYYETVSEFYKES